MGSGSKGKNKKKEIAKKDLSTEQLKRGEKENNSFQMLFDSEQYKNCFPVPWTNHTQTDSN